jgi:hypothetical protein
MMRLEKSLHRVRFTPRSQANSDREVGPKPPPARVLPPCFDMVAMAYRCASAASQLRAFSQQVRAR